MGSYVVAFKVLNFFFPFSYWSFHKVVLGCWKCFMKQGGETSRFSGCVVLEARDVSCSEK